MKVKYTDLEKNFSLYQDEYENAAQETLRSGWYILGPRLKNFESEFSKYIGSKNCIGVNSGTDALTLSIRALEIGPGDEVIVPANTYIASVLSIIENGATPVFIDADEFFLMDVDKIEENINANTKAILPVHMYGQACNMRKIMSIANKNGLYVIEDCAQAHGAEFNGKKVGTFGIVSCFSFYPTKPLGAFGDGGAINTDDDALAEKLRMLRNYGSKVKYENEIEGINSRLDEIQAAILSVGLQHLDEGNELRQSIASCYLEEINNKNIQLPKMNEESTHVFHLFPIICENRDKLKEYLNNKGIETQIHYPTPPYYAQCYKNFGYKLDDFSKAGFISNNELSLPIYSGMPESDVEYVIKSINEFTL